MCVCVCWQGKIKMKKIYTSDFLDCPRLKTLGFECRGRRFDSWSGNKDPTGRTLRPKNKKGKVTHTFIQSFAYNSRVLITTEKLNLRTIKLNQETKTKKTYEAPYNWRYQAKPGSIHVLFSLLGN